MISLMNSQDMFKAVYENKDRTKTDVALISNDGNKTDLNGVSDNFWEITPRKKK